MREITLEQDRVLSDDEAQELKAQKLDDRHYDDDLLFDDPDEDVTIYKPNGDLLAVVKRGAVPRERAFTAYKALRPAAMNSNAGNRSTATGEGSRKRRVLEDGSVSDTSAVPQPIRPNTGIAGNFDRYPRIPYCRQTAYNINNPEKWAKAIPMFQDCADVFEQYAPERFANQQEKAKQTEDDWIITETPFTTVTVNLNWQTAAHTDAGDLPEGFGVMTVVRLGDYEGAYYIQPQYRTAFDLYTGDVILSDVHEWHGNGPFTDTDSYYERLSCVLYYRREMEECGTQEEELARAQRVEDSRLHHGTLDDPREKDADAAEQVRDGA